MTTLLAALLAALAVILGMRPLAEHRMTRLTRGERVWDAGRAQQVARRWWERRAVGAAPRRRRAQRRALALQAIGALASELAAGAAPSEALLRAQGEPSVWPHAASAARWGSDIADALERDAEQLAVLGQIAACWRVGSRGVGLVDAVQHVAASERSAEDVRVEMEAQLAGPRATARLLSMLPLIGIGLGMLMGADPLAWLLGTLPGRLCLAAGVGLTLLGAWWTGRIAAGVEKRL